MTTTTFDLGAEATWLERHGLTIFVLLLMLFVGYAAYLGAVAVRDQINSAFDGPPSTYAQAR